MIRHRKIFYIISSVLVLASIASLVFLKLPLGIDFKGGSLLELEFSNNEDGSVSILQRDQVTKALEGIDTGSIQIQPAGDSGLILRFKDVNEQIHQEILKKLDEASEPSFEEKRFESIGSVIGRETARKTLVAMGLILVFIITFVALAFRKISYPIGSWRYGFLAILALVHDVTITVGIFVVYAYFTGEEAGVPFVAALLTILGYSVNDTIVIFDRIRDNLIRFGSRVPFEETVSKSVRQSVVRSINTASTGFLVLLAVFFFGGATLHGFAFTLLAGIVVGTYSSLMIASPLLVSWTKRLNR